jgi:hypothetical protein
MQARAIIAANLIMLSLGATLVAQTSAGGAAVGRVFVDGAVMADYDQTDFEPAGPAMATGFGIGARLWRRLSLRFEFDLKPRDGTAPTHTVFDDRDVEHWAALTLGVADHP